MSRFLPSLPSYYEHDARGKFSLAHPNTENSRIRQEAPRTHEEVVRAEQSGSIRSQKCPGTVEAQAGTVVEKSAPKRKGRGTFVATLKQLQKSISGSTTQNMEDALVETCLVTEFQRLSLADKEAEPEEKDDDDVVYSDYESSDDETTSLEKKQS